MPTSRVRVAAIVGVVALVGVIAGAFALRDANGHDSKNVSTPPGVAHTPPPTNALPEGSVAPDFVLPNIDGGQLSLASFRGKRVVLSFGAVWCSECKKEYPLLVEAQRNDTSIAVVSVVEREAPGIMRSYKRSIAATWPSGDDRDSIIADRYGVTVLPVTFFIAPSGRIVGRGFGITTRAELDPLLAKLRSTS